MNIATNKDDESIKSGQFAVAKLHMVNEVTTILRNKSKHYAFLEAHGLNALEFWISPLPNRSNEFASAKVIVCALDILSTLHVQPSDLEGDNLSIGKKVV